jgi:hypothetical protein
VRTSLMALNTLCAFLLKRNFIISNVRSAKDSRLS